MLETLMNLVRQQSGEAIVNNPAIPNEQNEDAMQTVMSSILGGLQQQAQGGNLGGLLGSLMGQQSASPQDNAVVEGVQQNVTGDLMSRFGISNQQALSITATIVPVVLGKLFNKASDPNDSSISVGDVMGAATGNPQAAGVDWMGMAGSAMADGKLDMGDLMRVAGGFMGGSGGQQGGGLGGMLGGLFGGR